VLEEWEAFSLE